jgi:Holliday junction resolvasome RuvABC ATP-dependent DNA helicase subunit
MFWRHKKQQKQIEIIVKDKDTFDEIIGHDSIKKILKNTINSVLKNKQPISVLLNGSPGCGKSLFLKEIEKNFPSPTSYYVDGSRATKAGIFDILFEDEFNRIKFLLIDEIDKLNLNDQEALLTLIQDGRIIQVQKNKTASKKYDNLSVIAASNDIDRIMEPLQTRFFDIHIEDYTDEQVSNIARLKLKRYDLNDSTIEYIIVKVLQSKKESKIRFAEQLAKLCNNNKEMVNLLVENSG